MENSFELLRRLAIMDAMGGNPERAIACAVSDGELTKLRGEKLLAAWKRYSA